MQKQNEIMSSEMSNCVSFASCLPKGRWKSKEKFLWIKTNASQSSFRTEAKLGSGDFFVSKTSHNYFKIQSEPAYHPYREVNRTGRFVCESVGECPIHSQDYNRYTYVNNNPLRFTDPSGYMAHGSGHNPSWMNTAWSLINQHAEWNTQMDYIFWRGDYVRAGFGGTTGYFTSFGTLLGSGSAGGGLLGMSQFTEAGRKFFKENYGINPVSQGGEGGYFKEVKGGGKRYTLSSTSYVFTSLSTLNSALGLNKPNYTEQTFSESGFQNSWINAEGIGFAGGFFYSIGGRVFEGYSGIWYIYVSSSALAPAAEQQAQSVSYYTTITVFENGKQLYRDNLKIWNPDKNILLQEGLSFIGDGYLKLPEIGNNITIEISTTYNMYQFWNGYAYPNSPYVFTIKF